MIQINDIPALLDQLEDHIADDLEGQELDFKQWEAPDGSFLSESQDMSHNPSNPSPAALLLVLWSHRQNWFLLCENNQGLVALNYVFEYNEIITDIKRHGGEKVMINKIYAGIKIAEGRKRLGLTQNELSEKLCVTPQAVSRWETGTSLPDLDVLLALSQLYGVSINQLVETTDTISQIACEPYEIDEIACFVPSEERDYNREFVHMIVKEKIISKAWALQKERNQKDSSEISMAKEITERGGLILMTGIGPGGSNLRALLQENPHAKLILNDLSPTVVKEWKKFLDGFPEFSELSYAAFDFCKIPFVDSCIDTICDYGGLVNTEGDIKAAFSEMFRVLKPGGLLITTGSFVKPSTFRAISKKEKEELTNAFPSLTFNLYDEGVDLGFSKIDTRITGEYIPFAGDSLLGDYLKAHDLSITMADGVRYCYK